MVCYDSICLSCIFCWEDECNQAYQFCFADDKESGEKKNLIDLH